MSERHERLQAARQAAGYATAAEAAEAMGVKLPTYTHHENGTRDITRRGVAERYARFYRVNLEWLMTGRGPQKPAQRPQARIPIEGVVGAGFAVEMIDDPAGAAAVDSVPIPDSELIGALRVRGDSQYPVFVDGEFVLFDKRPVAPRDLIGQLAIVQTNDGRRLLKTIRRGNTDRAFTLESYNAPPEENVALIGAWRYIGSLLR